MSNLMCHVSKDTDECEPTSPCQNGGTCVDKLNSLSVSVWRTSPERNVKPSLMCVQTPVAVTEGHVRVLIEQ